MMAIRAEVAEVVEVVKEIKEVQETKESKKATISFESIKEEYHNFYMNLLRNGRPALKNTDSGYWGASSIEIIWDVFNRLRLGSFSNFLDIGSGDGKVVLVASLFTESTGIETDKELYNKGVEIRNRLCLGRAGFINENYYEEDFSKFDALYHFPDQPMRKLEKKLLKEMKGILIHYGNFFKPLQLKKEKELKIGDITITVYTNPNKANPNTSPDS